MRPRCEQRNRQEPHLPSPIFPTRISADSITANTSSHLKFFFKETIAVVIAAFYSFMFTYVMLWIINKVTPVKVSIQEEETGLDEIELGEHAYL